MANRFVSEVWWLIGWPIQSSVVTEDSPEARAAVQFLKAALEACEELVEKGKRVAGLTTVL